ncbi:NAD-dependent protein deacylase-like protein [Phanerochaete sordida]|uniref:NAD-dependent protein deacylase-like protein n=1 Tax=Phanerochaete sordida TaxID=48140 RepID=A0A9P3LKC8_9APHY|nr:NAD-dependent protein deacylase-like protein [Phanerochaete sordida]
MISFPDILKSIAPEATFTFVTQNVDGLSTRALQEVAAREGADHRQAAPYYEMHGRVLDTICTACERRAHHSANEPLCPALAAAGALPTDPTSPSGVDTDEVRDIPLAQLPRCAACGGLLRPGVVWFGEQPLHMDEIDEAVAAADLCLVVGTSSTVYPAAGYAYEVADHGGKVAVFNLERTEGDDEADFLFLGPCEQTLPEALFGSTEVKSDL